jgi:hypothetical protein
MGSLRRPFISWPAGHDKHSGICPPGGGGRTGGLGMPDPKTTAADRDITEAIVYFRGNPLRLACGYL